MRFDLTHGRWVRTRGVLKIKKSEGEGENFNLNMSKAVRGPQYACPICGIKSALRCSACGKLTCFEKNKDSKSTTCAWCGKAMVTKGKKASSISGKAGQGQ